MSSIPRFTHTVKPLMHKSDCSLLGYHATLEWFLPLTVESRQATLSRSLRTRLLLFSGRSCIVGRAGSLPS